MRTGHGFAWLMVLGLGLWAAGCSAPEPESTPAAPEGPTAAALQVYTVNYPLRYFAERIGGDQVVVRFPAPADGDPAFWSPDAETIAGYQAADLILLNGAGYAKWTQRASLPPSRLVDTSGSFRERYIYIEDAVTHMHGPTGEHAHGDAAFTTWLDPTLAVEQARAILEALTRARPESAAAFQERFDSLERDLMDLDERLRNLTAAAPGRPLLASHPVYQYLAQRCGLNLRSVHFEPGEHPDEHGWQDLERTLDHPTAWMLWEGAPLDETADRLRQMGVQSMVFDPCGNAPAEGDYLTVMRENLRNLEGVLSPG